MELPDRLKVVAPVGDKVNADLVEAYAIYDSKAERFSSVLFFPNVNVARRAFGNSVNSVDSQMFFNPEDYTMFRIGSFDQSSGELVGTDKASVCNGLQVKRVEE